MNKRAIDTGHALKHVLQALAKIVAVAQTHTLIDDDVDLDVQFIAGVIGLQTLDFLDSAGEAHGQVEEDVAVSGRGGGASQVADVRRRGARPHENDVQREQQATEGVEPPDREVIAQQREDDAEGIEDDVRQGVLGQGLHAGVLDQAAPDPAEELD